MTGGHAHAHLIGRFHAPEEKHGKLSEVLLSGECEEQEEEKCTRSGRRARERDETRRGQAWSRHNMIRGKGQHEGIGNNRVHACRVHW